MPDLYLLRHGEAEPGDFGKPDHLRALTAKGRSDVRAQAKLLSSAGAPIGQIFHSPYVRAQETAGLVHEVVGSRLVPLPALEPGGKVELVIEALLGIDAAVLLVSHLPLVADLAETLLGERTSFFPGTCLGIYRENAFALKGVSQWLVHPG